MHVNAKPFKAGYSKAYLPKTHMAKIATKKEIARAHLSGVPAKELAADYGITIMSVIQIKKWYERELAQAKRLALAFVPVVVLPKPEKVDGFEPGDRVHCYGNQLTYSTEAKGDALPITLPLVSIQCKRQ